MELDKILLTPKEANDKCKQFQVDHWLECDAYESCQECPVLKQAQCLKLIEWLEKERMILHDNYSEFVDYEKNFKNWHRPDCKLCNLKESLKERNG